VKIPVNINGADLVGRIIRKEVKLTICIKFDYTDIFDHRIVDPIQFDLAFEKESNTWGFIESVIKGICQYQQSA